MTAPAAASPSWFLFLEAQTGEKMSEQITLKLSGMSCRACAALIQDELLETPGVDTAQVSFEEKQAQVVFERQTVDAQTLIERVTELGYQATVDS